MSFKQNNQKSHVWSRFARDNRDLMLQAGLPSGAIESYDAFRYLLDHGYVGLTAANKGVSYSPGAAYFQLHDLNGDQLRLFVELLQKCLEVGYIGEHEWEWYTQMFKLWGRI